MNKNLTDITVVMDRSGSMHVIQEKAQAGINDFVAEQKKLPGEAHFTLVQFDHAYEFVYKGVPIQSVLQIPLVPRGNTALLDAVGRAIVETGERLSKLAEADRPGLVVFLILTDGEENASTEYTKSKIKEMITHQQDVYQWKFQFLGANQDAFAEAAGYGIHASFTGNFSGKNVGNAYRAATAGIGRMRSAVARGAPEPEVKTCGGIQMAEREAMA